MAYNWYQFNGSWRKQQEQGGDRSKNLWYFRLGGYWNHLVRRWVNISRHDEELVIQREGKNDPCEWRYLSRRVDRRKSQWNGRIRRHERVNVRRTVARRLVTRIWHGVLELQQDQVYWRLHRRKEDGQGPIWVRRRILWGRLRRWLIPWYGQVLLRRHGSPLWRSVQE